MKRPLRTWTLGFLTDLEPEHLPSGISRMTGMCVSNIAHETIRHERERAEAYADALLVLGHDPDAIFPEYAPATSVEIGPRREA